jgi:hypothetical protein
MLVVAKLAVVKPLAEPVPQVVVATFPEPFTVRQFDPEVPSAVMARLVAEMVPGNATVWPALPIVMPVADDVPMEIVLDPSMAMPTSPDMVVLLNVSAAEAIEILAKNKTMATPMLPMESFFMLISPILFFIIS